MQGRFGWYEWMGDNVKAAADFYAHVVGWKAKVSDMAGGGRTQSSLPATMASPAQ